MEDLIPVINKLQDAFSSVQSNVKIDLPQIVVVGSQSSGKSSVLESLVGKDFLPRGSGICTRRPLVLQLQHISPSRFTSRRNSDDDDDDNNHVSNEWCEFLHIPNKKFVDFNLVREEIIKETDEVTGSNKGISSKPIRLKVCSPNVLTVTLVDLPGITKVPVGDQPSNIETLIREMCLEFVSNPNAIILAVTPGNSDLANSDSLKLAKEVDPKGNRTIGVITKLDLLDDGTDAVDALTGKIIPLKKGYIGVVNRSQAEINSNTKITESTRKESSFFHSHPSYKSMADRMGTQYLATQLNSLLLTHIRECLPDIKQHINKRLHEVNMELAVLGDKPVVKGDKASQGAALLALLSRFSTNFANSIDGKCSSGGELELTELRGGARIAYLFNEIFVKGIQKISPFEGLSDSDIRTAICNSTGPRASLFVPEVSFEVLVKRQIHLLQAPSLQCVDLVFDELQQVALQCEFAALSRFTVLKEKVLDCVNVILRENLKPTQDMIHNLINVELAYINTSHPDFIGGSRAVAKLADKMQDQQPLPRPTTGVNGGNAIDASAPGAAIVHAASIPRTASRNSNEGSGHGGNNFMSFIFGSSDDDKVADATSDDEKSTKKLRQMPSRMKQADVPITDRERLEMEIIKSLMDSYLDITKKNILDLVPKTIMYFLVNHAKNNIQSELVHRLYREDKFAILLREDDKVDKKRKQYYEMKDLLEKALSIVNEIREISI